MRIFIGNAKKLKIPILKTEKNDSDCSSICPFGTGILELF